MNSEAIITALEQVSDIRHQISGIEVFEELDSTNALLWERFAENVPMPRVAIAKCQTAGRGQWGKSWVSAAGGLYLSMLLPMQLEPQNAYSLAIATVWGIADQLRQANIPVQIKWANDLLLENKKLGGIKTETKIQQGMISAAVIGVGINYHNPVPDVGINLANFWDNQLQFPIEYLAALVISGIWNAVNILQQESMQAILPHYLKLLKNLGEMITYEGHQGEIVGVSEKGELLVKLSAMGSSSTIKIPAGQISLGY